MLKNIQKASKHQYLAEFYLKNIYLPQVIDVIFQVKAMTAARLSNKMIY